MTTEEIKDELYRMLSDVLNGNGPIRNNAQRGRYREAVKSAIEALEQEPSISEDGTLTVNVEDGSKVSRVLVCGDNHFGGLYYPDQEPCDKCVYSTSEGCQYDDITETIPPFETSDDAISRQAVLDSIHANCVYENEYNLTAKHIEDAVKQLPPVNPQKPICPSAGVDCEDCPAHEKKSEWEHDHEILKAYSDGANAVLNKIRDEIREQSRMHMDGDLYIKTSSCMQIINDYMAEEDKA